jgi:regulator of sigma E protease
MLLNLLRPENLLTLIVFLLVLSILVIVHEFGHFIVAKKSGIGVWEFALGLPFTKPVWSKQLASGMKLSLYPILFGGFVRLLGEDKDEGATNSRDKQIKGKQFYGMPLLTRMAVVVAGVAMNFLFAAILFYVFLAVNNFRVLIPRFASYEFMSPHNNVVVVTYVAPKSPAIQAGFVFGDVVLEADGKKFEVSSEFKNYIKEQSGREMKFLVANQSLTNARVIFATPRVAPPVGEGALGIGIGEGVAVQYLSLPEKLTSGVVYSADMLVYNVKVLSMFVKNAVKTGNTRQIQENISGPIGIATTIGEILKQPLPEAVKSIVNFTGVLSLSLAFVNLLPIPAMDGGRLMFLIYEGVTRRRFPTKYEMWINQGGMIFLLLLIILISYSDVRIRILGW